MRKYKINKIISIFLCLVMIFSCLPLNVFAIENEHIVEPGTYTFDENGNLICSECGEIDGHSEDCTFYKNKEIATDSNAIKECNCEGDIHSVDCYLYEEPSDSCECELLNGVHDETCKFFVKPETTCTCNSVYHIHEDTCPLYVLVEDNSECTCNSDTDKHSNDCPLYKEIVNECDCNLENGSHAEDCFLYKTPIADDKTCDCGFIDGMHLGTCPLFELVESEDDKYNCTCGTESDFHDEGCPLYKLPDVTFDYLASLTTLNELYEVLYNKYEVIQTFTNTEKEALLARVNELYNFIEIPTEEDTQQFNYLCNIINSYIIVICEDCGQEDGFHLDDCEFYICEECNQKEHSEDCSKYIKIDVVCEECGEKNGVHLETCSLYVKTCDECGAIDSNHKETCSLWVCNECGAHEHLDTCSLYIKKCEECNGVNGEHKEDCSLWVCDECFAHEHLETCSQFKIICEECQGENNNHKETCSKFVDNRPLYERILDSDFDELYEILTDEENVEELDNLTEEEIDEIIYYVGLIADDEDLEIELLALLYELSNAPECPWKTLESDYIYFDLYYGNVSITGSTYSGYDSTGQVVSGTHMSENQYYIYQSTGGSTIWEDGLPVYDRVTYSGQDWGEYITNHPSKSSAGAKSVDEVITAWGSVNHKATTVTSGAAAESGRMPTPYYVKVQGNGTFNVVIDDLWSSYQVKYSTSQQNASSFKNDLGGFVYVPENTNCLLNLYLVGDNRFGNIHAATHDGTNGKYTVDTNHTNTITVQTLSGENDATLTLSNLWTNADTNSTASCIGGTDGHDHSVKMIFNSGIIYAGSGYKDFCTPIGGGGNGDGRVIINGGIITAVNSSTGAAIGGGCGTTGPGGYGEVHITDGEVYAYSYAVFYTSGSYYNNALPTAIGGGSSGTQIGGIGIVNISGGYIYAYSQKGNAIGGGGGGYGIQKSGDTTYDSATGGIADINISGGEIHAISGSGCSIGGGPGGGRSYDAYYTKNSTLPADTLASGKKVVANGGSATLVITGGDIYTGSIGGGSPQFHDGTDKNKYGFTIGAATVYISGGETHGQVVMEGTGSRFEMEDGIIDNSFIGSEYKFVKEDGGAVYVKTGNAIINGGTIKNSSANNGGAVYVNGGNFEMNDGEIIDCTAINGGAINVDTGNFTMNGGYIYDNIADYGGAVYVNGGSFEIYGGEISDNEAIDGGAAYINGGDVINIYNGIFDNNDATNNGGAIYAMSDASDIIINVFDGVITNNTAGNHGGAIGASASGNYAVILNIGEIDCLGVNSHLHDDGDCPIITNNIAQEYGGAFCLHGNSDALAVNIYCGGITTNRAIKNYGSNSINQGGGAVTVWGGQIDPGIMVGGGIYTDNRIDSDQIVIRFWSNYPGGPDDYYPIECTIGVTVTFPLDTYVWEGHELSGWATAPDASGLYVPVQGEHTIEDSESGYLDFYAVWDATTSYIVYIPESVDIDVDDGIGTMDISADIKYFKKNSNLNIFINGDFELINDSCPDDVLFYNIVSSEFNNQILSDNAIAATFQYNNVIGKIINAILINGSKRYSGNYFDTLTFTVEYTEN